MSRSPSATDYTVQVDGVGLFTFGRRKMADHVKIQVEYSRLTEGVEPTPWLDCIATWLSVLKVLTVRSPDTFVLDDLDPLDDDTYANLLKVHAALRAKEDDFRLKSQKSSEAGGQGASGDA